MHECSTPGELAWRACRGATGLSLSQFELRECTNATREGSWREGLIQSLEGAAAREREREGERETAR